MSALNSISDLAFWVVESGYRLDDACGYFMLADRDDQPTGMRLGKKLEQTLKKRGWLKFNGDLTTLTWQAHEQLKLMHAKATLERAGYTVMAP